ncbi:MAG: 4Fe-4S dicluster domain-containing protein [Vulcanimicrobiaceae bacterium]
MSEVLRPKVSRGRAGTARTYSATVQELNFGPGGTAPTVTLVDGRSGTGSCLGCHDTPCMEKSRDELALAEPLSSFPGDPTLDVCPTKALSWDEKHQRISVNSAQCIGCGLCVSRCPYGGMYLGEERIAVILADDPDRLARDKPSPAIAHARPARRGTIGRTTAAALVQLPEALSRLADGRAPILIRNLLHELGVKCRSRRRGDTNIRIDAVGALSDGNIVVMEIELSNAALESPRALLEDLAVMHSRYGIELASMDPLSIVTALPNGRSEYYRVIDDITNVLGLSLRTVSVAALIILVWHFKRVTTMSGTLFSTTATSPDLSSSLLSFLPNLDPALEPYAGAFRPAK